mgnify:FL=1
MSKEKIKLNSEKINKRESRIKVLKLGLLISTVFLIVIFFLLKVVYGQGPFTISLDQNFAKKSGIVYDNSTVKEFRRILEAGKLEFMDNISIRWIPDNIDTEAEGAHNGNNYIAYTFFIENNGNENLTYWAELVIDDVIRDADEAVRIMVFRNGEKKIYAKRNSNGEPEPDTIPFYSDQYVYIEPRENFYPNDVDRYTIVVWVEGDDPDCINDIIGGEMKMHLEINEEHVQK